MLAPPEKQPTGLSHSYVASVPLQVLQHPSLTVRQASEKKKKESNIKCHTKIIKENQICYQESDLLKESKATTWVIYL
jgi:hypothetical protein